MELHLTPTECHICHPTQVNTLRLHPSQTRRYSIYLPRRTEGWVDLGDTVCCG